MSRRLAAQVQANRRTAGILALAVAAMFGFGFALVPLYDAFCELTGLGGRTNSTAVAASELTDVADSERTVTVEFVANLDAGAPWEFKPSVSKMQIHPGAFYRTSFVAKNLTDQPLVGQAAPSVAPAIGARHFQKIECFCFSRQAFAPGEAKDMPVVFRIDPALSKDIDTITLSYTFFKVDNSES
jgi:cytochrome c oxidase assembly protein subunit 11